jgi:hypothetical protein
MTKTVFVFSEYFFPLLAKIKKCSPPPNSTVHIYYFFLVFCYFLKIHFQNKLFSENSVHNNKIIRIFSNDHSKFSRILFQKQGIRHALAQLAVNVASPTIVTLC